MQYRAYFIDDHEHVRGATDVDAATIADAIETARALSGDQGIELWEVDRFICRFEPINPQYALSL